MRAKRKKKTPTSALAPTEHLSYVLQYSIITVGGAERKHDENQNPAPPHGPAAPTREMVRASPRGPARPREARSAPPAGRLRRRRVPLACQMRIRYRLCPLKPPGGETVETWQSPGRALAERWRSAGTALAEPQPRGRGWGPRQQARRPFQEPSASPCENTHSHAGTAAQGSRGGLAT